MKVSANAPSSSTGPATGKGTRGTKLQLSSEMEETVKRIQVPVILFLFTKGTVIPAYGAAFLSLAL